jgi:hypothetical protein
MYDSRACFNWVNHGKHSQWLHKIKSITLAHAQRFLKVSPQSKFIGLICSGFWWLPVPSSSSNPSLWSWCWLLPPSWWYDPFFTCTAMPLFMSPRFTACLFSEIRTFRLLPVSPTYYTCSHSPNGSYTQHLACFRGGSCSWLVPVSA